MSVHAVVKHLVRASGGALAHWLLL